jgi:hypothetical protein
MGFFDLWKMVRSFKIDRWFVLPVINVFVLILAFRNICIFYMRGHAVALKAGRSRDRFPMVSLQFFVEIILPAEL